MIISLSKASFRRDCPHSDVNGADLNRSRSAMNGKSGNSGANMDEEIGSIMEGECQSAMGVIGIRNNAEEQEREANMTRL